MMIYKLSRKIVLSVAAILLSTAAFAADIFECEFTPGRWNKADFIQVKSSRWRNINEFKQEPTHIYNVCPSDATNEEMLGPRAGETYAALIYKQPLSGSCDIKSEMSFDYRMAPSIVIANKLGADVNKFPEFREHYEVVLYDEGVNVWHHWFKDGKQVWRRVGFLPVKILPKVKYELEVEVKRTLTGTILEVSVADREMIVKDINLDNEYYAGIIGCEGINRFYDFEIDK